MPPGSGGAFGFSIFLYALLGSLMHGIRPLFRRGRWELPILMTGAGTFLLLTLEYGFINFRRAGFSFQTEVWKHIAATSVLSMIVAPFAFLLINFLAKLSGYSIRYEGLATRNASARAIWRLRSSLVPLPPLAASALLRSMNTPALARAPSTATISNTMTVFMQPVYPRSVPYAECPDAAHVVVAAGLW